MVGREGAWRTHPALFKDEQLKQLVLHLVNVGHLNGPAMVTVSDATQDVSALMRMKR
jgi:hypothetical protein